MAGDIFIIDISPDLQLLRECALKLVSYYRAAVADSKLITKIETGVGLIDGCMTDCSVSQEHIDWIAHGGEPECFAHTCPNGLGCIFQSRYWASKCAENGAELSASGMSPLGVAKAITGLTGVAEILQAWN
jgi:hypothetical protein